LAWSLRIQFSNVPFDCSSRHFVCIAQSKLIEFFMVSLRNWTSRRFVLPEVTILIASLATSVALAQTESLPPLPPGSDAVEEVSVGDAALEEGVEVLTRGPLHEAFAAPIEQDPQAGELVPEAPPEPIQELPPDVKLEGENVQWIPGYWAWDEQEKRYIWISGVWRAIPPGREWVPGYWVQDAGGHRWISGYWGPAAPPGDQVAREVFDAAVAAEAYVAPPPESLEVGPTSPQPSDLHFWVPGCWIAADAGYRWRPGFWYGYQPNWVWVPDHYVWSPAGCLFISGYWDYTLQARGMCFAPVYFTQTIYTQPYYTYRPYCALELAHLALHLFVHPWSHHYCYGDYYGPAYAAYGYRPWFDFHYRHPGHHHHHHHRYYNPLLTYYDTHYHRHDIDYIDRLQGWHRHFVHHSDHRPPTTYRKQKALAQRGVSDLVRKHTELARSIDEVRRIRGEGRFVVDDDRLPAEVRDRQRRQIEAARDVAQARRAMERDAERPREVVRAQDDGKREEVRSDGAARERISNAIGEEQREQFRRAIQKSRQLARRPRELGQGSLQSAEVQRARDARERAGQLGRLGIESGQGSSPDRAVAGANRIQELRERQRVRIFSGDRTDPLNRMRGRERTIDMQSQARALERLDAARRSAEIDRNRRQVESARRIQDAIAARQRNQERFRGPQAQSGFDRISPSPVPRGGRESVGPSSIDRARAAAQRARGASRQLERPNPSVQRSAPSVSPRSEPRQRSFTPSRAREVRSGPKASPSKVSPSKASSRGNSGKGKE
jgi:hypothetical protein